MSGRRDRAAAGQGSAPEPVRGGPRAWPLVGRAGLVADTLRQLRAPHLRGVVVTAPAGLGKSSLLDAVAARTSAPLLRVYANADAQGLPLAAVAPLLPADADPGDPVRLLQRTVAVVSRLPGQPLLVVDDAHHLDTASAVLLGQVLHRTQARLLAAVREPGRLPDALDALVRSGEATVLELPPLTAAEVGEALRTVLGGAVAGSAGHELHRSSGGNPLLLRELVHAARQSGALEEHDGTWFLTGALPPSPRLGALVAERVAGVPEGGRRVLEVLSLADRLPLEVVERWGTPDELAVLEADGLVAVSTEPGEQRLFLSLAHPSYGEALRDRLGALRARALRAALADALEESGARTRADRLQLAEWRLDSGGRPDPDLLLDAASWAYYAGDLPQAERLARHVWEDTRRPEAAEVLGWALHDSTRYDEAEQVLAEGYAAGRPGQRLGVVIARARNLLYGLHRDDEAVAMLEAEPTPDEGPDRARKLVQLGYLRLTTTMGVDDGVLEALDPSALGWAGEVERCLTLAYARAFRGRTADALRLLDHAEVLLADVPQPPASYVRTMLSYIHCLTLAYAGRLDEAAEASEKAYGEALDARRPLAELHALSVWCYVDTIRGRPRTVLARARETLVLARRCHQPHLEQFALADIVWSAAVLRETATVDEALAELERLPHGPEATSPPEAFRARGWARVAHGDLRGAAEAFEQAGAAAAAMGCSSLAAVYRHEAVRVGHAPEPLHEVAAATDSVLFAAAARHATALAERDAVALERVAEELAATGASLVAAEAAAAAAELHRAAGRGGRARIVAARSAELAAACEGAVTPALRRAEAAAAPLTAREREIAELAAAGMTSREIAERLVISPRTVETHVQRVYTKLGVNSRAELERLLSRSPGRAPGRAPGRHSAAT